MSCCSASKYPKQYEQGSKEVHSGSKKNDFVGSKSATVGLEKVTSMARNRHDLGSKTAQFGLEVHTLTFEGKDHKYANLARKTEISSLPIGKIFI